MEKNRQTGVIKENRSFVSAAISVVLNVVIDMPYRDQFESNSEISILKHFILPTQV